MEFQIDVQGYYKDQSRKGFPHTSGIYFVYRGIYAPYLKTVTLIELLYIGETEDLFQRHNDHNMRNEFMSKLNEGEELFYSLALTNELTPKQRLRLESALIYELRPRLNIRDVETYDYDETTINILGDRHAYVPSHIKAPSY